MGKIKDILSPVSSKKMLIGLVLTVIIISSGIFIFYQKNQPLEVKTVQLKKADYEEYHYEEGTVMTPKSMKVYSDGHGKILDLFIKEGTKVKAGDVILNIDKGELKNRLEILYTDRASLLGSINSQIQLQEEAVGIAKNKVTLLETELARKTTLFKSGAISKKELEDSEYEYKQGVSALNTANVQLKALQDKLNYESDKIRLQIKQLEDEIKEMQVAAPINGVVASFSLKKGDYVGANQLLFEVFHPDSFQVEAFVLAKEVKNLQVGMIAYIEVETQGKTHTMEGKITLIAPNATEFVSPLGLVEKKVKVLIALEAKDNLIQGEKVDVKFITYSKENAQVVSKDYIFPWKNQEAMWIIEEGKAKIFEINKAFDASSVVVLKDELEEQTKIIIPPYPEKIAEGVKVLSK